MCLFLVQKLAVALNHGGAMNTLEKSGLPKFLVWKEESSVTQSAIGKPKPN